ncbi:hypothetical protein [Ligilactobacillus ruminis]|uniref:hypothetical protein n=1 Tax=Ligilactobacillus ruminis TaxID=1623 RepID=UPI00325C2639
MHLTIYEVAHFHEKCSAPGSKHLVQLVTQLKNPWLNAALTGKSQKTAFCP